ncbi:cobalt transport protein CbiN [Enterococcus florum]|uniref:Cobalt transport protein CbiN n=1 Tax=Enterococcus florum TaxID=2480627 RepID=A0A4P5PDG1_9ENTE|nr:energy-coupling factor ABC transporter substrate-binding protein [Enterococcus florum]GCF93582.1 cobalt transport protein CbiN [Enterococcus florum]
MKAESKTQSKTGLNIILLLAVVLLMVGALLINQNGEYGGSDGQAEEMITELNPDYTPWFESLLEPKSGEIESLLFTLQGSLGVGIITYILGYYKGKKKHAAD